MRGLILMFTLLFSSLSHAWEPTKPVNVIIGMTPGSAMDNAFRIVSAQVEKNTGVKFVPTYRPGAGGTIAVDAVSKAEPDGYTMLTATHAGMVATDRMVVPNKTFGPRDFVFATAYASSTMSIIAHPSDPVNSIQDLVKALKNEKTTVGDPGAGARITYEILRANIGFEESTDRVARVDYKGPNDTVLDVMAKNVRFGIVPIAASAQQHIAGKVKIIALTRETPSPTFPNIPLMNSVYPDAVFSITWAAALPKNTPAPVVEWYTREFNKASQSKEVQQTLAENFFFVDKKLLTSKELTAKILSDEKKYEPLVNRVLEQRK